MPSLAKDVKGVEQSGLDSRADHTCIPVLSIGERFAIVAVVSVICATRAKVWSSDAVGAVTVGTLNIAATGPEAESGGINPPLS